LHARHDRRRQKLQAAETITFLYRLPGPGSCTVPGEPDRPAAWYRATPTSTLARALRASPSETRTDRRPHTYCDFAYVAFTIGMCYQVSDTAVRDRRIRRTVLSHALLSYVFGVAIVAGSVNLIAGLIR
jgi:Protein of unknown function (DUF1345)